MKYHKLLVICILFFGFSSIIFAISSIDCPSSYTYNATMDRCEMPLENGGIDTYGEGVYCAVELDYSNCPEDTCNGEREYEETYICEVSEERICTDTWRINYDGDTNIFYRNITCVLDYCANTKDTLDNLVCYRVNLTANQLGVCSVNTKSYDATSGLWVNNNEVLPTDETCNGLNDDCDDSTDEGLCTNNDGDGHYLGDKTGFMCSGGDCYDCNDNNLLINEHATEICNGLNDDCDDSTDENVCIDMDNDGFFNDSSNPSKIDCDPSNPLINPGAEEEFNGFDDDCDGEIDEGWYWKQDRKGFVSSVESVVITCDWSNEGAWYKIPDKECISHTSRPTCTEEIQNKYFGGDEFEDECLSDHLKSPNLGYPSEFWSKHKCVCSESISTIHLPVSTCEINQTHNYLQCDILVDQPITVYQNISHLELGNYTFNIDIIDAPSLNIVLTSDEGNENCNSLPCSFHIDNNLTNLSIELVFSGSGAVDNVSIYKTDGIDSRFDIQTSLNSVEFFDSDPASCCPIDYCWNGSTCVNSKDFMTGNKSMPLFNDSKGGYICALEPNEFGKIPTDEENISNTNAYWKYAEFKFDPYHDSYSYCPQETMCLVLSDFEDGDYNTDTIYNGCVYNGTFVAPSGEGHIRYTNFNHQGEDTDSMDFYCNEGSWTSRTKLLAMKLLEIGNRSGKSFVLFCDKPDYDAENTALNYYTHDFGDYDPDWNNDVMVIGEGNKLFNNFCTLIIDTSDENKFNETFDVNDTVIIGSSMNKHLSDPLHNSDTLSPYVSDVFEGLFGDNCFDEETYNAGKFSKCKDLDNQLFYNNETWSFIYSDKPLTINVGSPSISIESIIIEKINFFEKIGNFFNNIVDFIIGLFSSSEDTLTVLDDSYVLKEDVYNKLYFAKINGVGQIEGINQRKKDEAGINFVDYAYFKFINYSICGNSSINPDKSMIKLSVQSEEDYFEKYSFDENSCIFNETTGTSTLMIIGTDSTNEYRINDLWYDLTGKIRPREASCMTGTGFLRPHGSKSCSCETVDLDTGIGILYECDNGNLVYDESDHQCTYEELSHCNFD